MKIVLACFLVTIINIQLSFSQSETIQDMKLPYEAIDGYPINYESGNIVKRIVDGLGYRYYWATDSLRQEDLGFKPSEDSRTSLETLEHVLNLSNLILNCASGKTNIRPLPEIEYTWQDMRATTLNNIAESANLFSEMSAEQLESSTLNFQRGENNSSVPFWHILNGPIADAIYHVGQIVSNRRVSGNPLDSRVNVFNGKNR